jgi:hypothetical protein
VTYYVALPFVAGDDGVAAGEPTECFNPNAAVMHAYHMPAAARLISTYDELVEAVRDRCD